MQLIYQIRQEGGRFVVVAHITSEADEMVLDDFASERLAHQLINDLQHLTLDEQETELKGKAE